MTIVDFHIELGDSAGALEAAKMVKDGRRRKEAEEAISRGKPQMPRLSLRAVPWLHPLVNLEFTDLPAHLRRVANLTIADDPGRADQLGYSDADTKWEGLIRTIRRLGKVFAELRQVDRYPWVY